MYSTPLELHTCSSRGHQSLYFITGIHYLRVQSLVKSKKGAESEYLLCNAKRTIMLYQRLIILQFHDLEQLSQF